MNHQYTAYGLRLRADFEIPGLNQTTGLPACGEVCLETRSKPLWAREASRLPSEIIHFLPAAHECNDPAFVVRKLDEGRFFQLSYSDGTEFLVDNHGEQIWGTCPPPLTQEDLVTYLLGPVMGFVLRRKGATPLHASAVRLGGSAVVFAGPAGAGKSTTAAALALHGAAGICEDIAVLHEEDGNFFLHPGYPRVCLWPDAVEKLLGSRNALPDLTPTWDKKYLGLDGKRASFEQRKLPVGVIYLLAGRSDEDSAPRFEEIPGREALMELVSNTYMNQLLTREQRAEEFELLSRLVNRVPYKRLVPHRNASKIGALCEMIENASHPRLGNPQISIHAPRG